jgi:hypothetical protein
MPIPPRPPAAQGGWGVAGSLKGIAAGALPPGGPARLARNRGGSGQGRRSPGIPNATKKCGAFGRGSPKRGARHSPLPPQRAGDCPGGAE